MLHLKLQTGITDSHLKLQTGVSVSDRSEDITHEKQSILYF